MKWFDHDCDTSDVLSSFDKLHFRPFSDFVVNLFDNLFDNPFDGCTINSAGNPLKRPFDKLFVKLSFDNVFGNSVNEAVG